jgi:hypothetical protein
MPEETTEAAPDNAVLEVGNATYFSEDNLEDYVSVIDFDDYRLYITAYK